MRHAGLSQNALAAALSTPAKKVYASAVNRWLRTDEEGALPSGEYMVRLPEALGVSGHWLLTGEGEMIPPAADRVERAFLEIARIVDEARGLPGPAVEPGAGASTAAEDDEARRAAEASGAIPPKAPRPKRASGDQ